MFASKRRPLLALLVLAGALALPAFAADKKNDPAKEQARRMQQMQRKFEQEKSQLTQEKAELEEKFKEASGELEETRKQATRKTSALEKQLAATRNEKEALGSKLAETEQRLAALTEQQRNTEAERKRLETLAAEQKKSLADCAARNEKLHEQGVELLERYEQKGCFSAALQGEPFTGLKRVAIENFMEDNRERLDEQKLQR
ncbi:hypothetical protein [Rhodocyclus tenuis]|uniref:hypothetical protein n=1 Tax=Rhodocyclus tenuis TaxID=1066 RepID=UPI0019080A32|nr:hypothetical protein [Rhodocyclus tenuis]